VRARAREKDVGHNARPERASTRFLYLDVWGGINPVLGHFEADTRLLAARQFVEQGCDK